MDKIITPIKAGSDHIQESLQPPIKKLTTTLQILAKVLKIVLIVLCVISYSCLIPVFLLLMSPLYVYRFVVVVLAKKFRPDLVRIVCTRDVIVGLDDVTKKCQCALNIMLTYRGDPDLEQIRNIFQTKVMDVKDEISGEATYQKFTQYYESWLGYPFWKQEESFNLNDHVRYCEETEALLCAKDEGNNNNNEIENGNGNEKENFVTEEQLMQIMGPISTRRYRKGMSPWEALIVRNFVPSPGKIHTDVVPTIEVGGGDETKKFVLILRLHHAISDGYSIMKLIMTNLSNEPMSRIPSPPVRKMGYFELAMMYIGIAILSPYYHLKQFVIDVDRNFWHMPERKLTTDWHCIRSEGISMTGLKEISKAEKVTTTAVLLTGFGSGIRRFLQETGQEDKMPKVMRALAPMPWKDHPMNGLVNHWTLGFMVLPIGIDCPKRRLRVADESIQLLKSSPILYTNFLTVPMFLAPPGWLTDTWATNWMTTMVLSNFPGPNFPIKSFDRYYIEDVTFWAPTLRGSSSIGVAFLSYNGGMRITASIDKKIIPTQSQADLLTNCINQEIKKLRGAVLLGENVV